LVRRPEDFALDQIIVFADRGLYVAKSEGRNRAVGVLPPAKEKLSASAAVDLADVRFVRDTGPELDGGTAGVDQESVVR
jgi:hypothetical protein